MMIIPPKKYDEMYEKVIHWIDYSDLDALENKLKPDAPPDAVEAWEWLKKHPLKTELD